MNHAHVDKRERWFDEGAPLFRRTVEVLGLGHRLPPKGDYYACPCCLIALPREALTRKELTEEHVPPERLGGDGLVLTCVRCNSYAGTKFDAHAIREAAFDDFATGQAPGGPVPAIMYTDGLPLRGTAQASGTTGYFLMGAPKQNDPKVEAAHWKAMEAMSQRKDQPPSLSFTIPLKFDPVRAKLSWVRSAYLAAFAALGWRYILRPALHTIRTQLANANSQILPRLTTYNPHVPKSDRQMLVVDTPEDIRSVVVIIGGVGIFLPSLEEPLSCAELSQALAQRVDSQGRLNIHLAGKEVPWPSKPCYLLDRS